jgi:hypothetical protein
VNAHLMLTCPCVLAVFCSQNSSLLVVAWQSEVWVVWCPVTSTRALCWQLLRLSSAWVGVWAGQLEGGCGQSGVHGCSWYTCQASTGASLCIHPALCCGCVAGLFRDQMWPGQPCMGHSQLTGWHKSAELACGSQARGHCETSNCEIHFWAHL